MLLGIICGRKQLRPFPRPARWGHLIGSQLGLKPRTTGDNGAWVRNAKNPVTRYGIGMLFVVVIILGFLMGSIFRLSGNTFIILRQNVTTYFSNIYLIFMTKTIKIVEYFFQTGFSSPLKWTNARNNKLEHLDTSDPKATTLPHRKINFWTFAVWLYVDLTSSPFEAPSPSLPFQFR